MRETLDYQDIDLGCLFLRRPLAMFKLVFFRVLSFSNYSLAVNTDLAHDAFMHQSVG